MYKRTKKLEDWFESLLLEQKKTDEKSFVFNNVKVKKIKNHFEIDHKVSNTQKQTEVIFGFKWNKTNTYKDGINQVLSKWLKKKYKKKFYGNSIKHGSTLLDAGCGSALSARLLFGNNLKKLNYIGTDISDSVNVAKKELNKIGVKNVLFKCDLNKLPLKKESIDLIFSEGVLHHTDNPFKTLKKITHFLKPSGIIMFYVYKKKAPIREFSDKLIRDKLKELKPQEAWKNLIPLTKLGRELGRLNKTINIEDDIELLEIPKGRIKIQRLFYWYIFKAFFNERLSLSEMHHINFDWYSPINASTHTEKEVRDWCKKLKINILDITVDKAGISIIAKK